MLEVRSAGKKGYKMTHEEAIKIAIDAEWEVIASSRGMCGENHPFEAGLRAYLTARDCVLMPREGYSEKPYYFAPEIDEECSGEDIQIIMDCVPVHEVTKIEEHRRTAYRYAVWINESTLLDFATEEEATAALVAAMDRREKRG